MNPTAIIALLYICGMVLLIAELFVPSHGLLTLGSLTCFGLAIYRTFEINTTGGTIALILALMLVPSVLLLGLKYVDRLPMGNRLAPPNPERVAGPDLTDHPHYADYIGKIGKSITPLRPVGVCEFNGRRVSCVAESDIIDAGVTVVGFEVRFNNLAVRPQSSAQDQA